VPDITMCRAPAGDEGCERASQCRRNAASGTKPCEYRQAYFLETAPCQGGKLPRSYRFHTFPFFMQAYQVEDTSHDTH
jgi:hypothetical protein